MAMILGARDGPQGKVAVMMSSGRLRNEGCFHFGDGLENCGMPFDREALAPVRFLESRPVPNHCGDPRSCEVQRHPSRCWQFIGITITRRVPLMGRVSSYRAANEK